MVRKIKVIQVETQDITIEKDPVVEIPSEYPVIQSSTTEVSDKASIDTNDTLALPELRQLDEVETPKEIPITESKILKGTCNLCGKTMLIKNLKYAHPKVCKNREPTPEIPPPPAPYVVIDKVVVQVNEKPDKVYINRPETAPQISPEEQYKMAKQSRVDVRKQKLKSLIANAF